MFWAGAEVIFLDTLVREDVSEKVTFEWYLSRDLSDDQNPASWRKIIPSTGIKVYKVSEQECA